LLYSGAFYYYHTVLNKTYEDTMIDVKAYADSVGIPYRHWLADSWWYYKGAHACQYTPYSTSMTLSILSIQA
jgi:hypothetical protein